ncbi:PREDICTED: myocyte-specific enhancer factor 2B-like [Lupinus angustifolius]|uniref:myocyte-specific enhancer factor 2B-like n=1 Tax=Lupinus angustifolius TaxID=3871 RepID=UPI00092E7501|nr:PREDICTED: myocyte-specific enhancer factor 2B-like [Lupinus angustifolius]
MSNSIPSSSNPTPSSSNPKKNKGRRRIEMKIIAKDKNLQVTFSKCHTRLFKKASELWTLCDAKFGLVVFSPANKAFSFGDPSIDVVVDRYQMRDQPLTEAHRNANSALENLKKNVLGVVEKQNIDEGASTVAAAIPPPPHFFTRGASSSNNPLPPPPQPPTQEYQVQPPPPPQQFMHPNHHLSSLYSHKHYLSSFRCIHHHHHICFRTSP